jgi:hypothetical protein
MFVSPKKRTISNIHFFIFWSFSNVDIGVHVIFELDSKLVVDAIYAPHDGVSEFSSLIYNIKNVLLLNPNFVVKFVKRQVNMVVHTLDIAAIFRPSRDVIELLPLVLLSYYIMK